MRKKSGTASKSGVTPPSTSTLRQPKCGIIHAARKPPQAAPSGKPQNIRLMMVARRWSGQYSPIIVTALGMAAPRPTPVTKRSHVSSPMLVENAETRQVAPNSSTAPSSIERRPTRSESGPETSAPQARPNSAALSTGASAGLEMPHSPSSEGAMKPIAAVSKPSSRTMTKHIAKMNH